MKKNEKSINTIKKRKILLLNIIFKFLIFFSNISLSFNNTIIYIKTNGIINQMKIIDEENNIANIFQETHFNYINDIFKKEIEIQYGEHIILNILKNENEESLFFGILLQIENLFFELDNSIFEVSFDKNLCIHYLNINIDDTLNKNILCCNIDNINEITITISIPINDDSTTNTVLKCNYF